MYEKRELHARGLVCVMDVLAAKTSGPMKRPRAPAAGWRAVNVPRRSPAATACWVIYSERGRNVMCEVNIVHSSKFGRENANNGMEFTFLV
jgi:hypothetical protein